MEHMIYIVQLNMLSVLNTDLILDISYSYLDSYLVIQYYVFSYSIGWLHQVDQPSCLFSEVRKHEEIKLLFQI